MLQLFPRGSFHNDLGFITPSQIYIYLSSIELTYHIVSVGEDGLGEDVLLLLYLLVGLLLGVLSVLVAALAPVPVGVIVRAKVLVWLAVRQQTEQKRIVKTRRSILCSPSDLRLHKMF